jgi:hypothetical protein
VQALASQLVILSLSQFQILLTRFAFFPSLSLLLSLHGTFCYLLKFSMLSLIFFLQLQEKSPYFAKFVKKKLFCLKNSSLFIHFIHYWLCFSSLCTLQLGWVKVNIKATA